MGWPWYMSSFLLFFWEKKRKESYWVHELNWKTNLLFLEVVLSSASFLSSLIWRSLFSRTIWESRNTVCTFFSSLVTSSSAVSNFFLYCPFTSSISAFFLSSIYRDNIKICSDNIQVCDTMRGKSSITGLLYSIYHILYSIFDDVL